MSGDPSKPQFSAEMLDNLDFRNSKACSHERHGSTSD